MSFGFGFSLPAYEGYAAGFGATSFGSGTTLALDFLNGNNTLDPRITFSRTTNATLTNSAGLVAYAPHNLLTHSEQFDNAAWGSLFVTTMANTVVAPDGTVTADTVTATSSTNYHDVEQLKNSAVAANTAMTLSVYLKAKTHNFASLIIEGSGTTAWVACAANLSTGNVTQTGAGAAGTYTASSITSVGNGWYRVSLTGSTTAVFNKFKVALSSSATPTWGSYANESWTTVGTESIYIWGAQLELGSTATTYNPTTVKNLLGYTEQFDNAAWTKSNLFVQTNLLTYSQDFDNAAWTKFNCSITPNAALAPDNTLTADRLTAAASLWALVNSSGFPALNGVTATVSVYVKSANGLTQKFRLGVNGSDISNEFTATTEWQRFQFTSVGDINNAAGIFRDAADSAADLYIWGAQLVQGTSAGDYKATYASAAAVGYPDIYGQPFAQKLVESADTARHIISQNLTVVNGSINTITVYAKAAERNWLYILEDTEGNYAFFNLATGTVGTVALATATITPVGNDWYRCSLTHTQTGGTTERVRIGVTTGNLVFSSAGDGTSGIYIFGAQLSDSASVDPYVYQPVAAPASTAYYGSRFDYDAVTLQPKGLLIEEQRTNLLTYSEQFDNAAWLKQNITVITNTIVAPDGTSTADAVIPANATNTAAGVYQFEPTAPPKTFSCRVKKGSKRWAILAGYNGTSSCWFDLNLGVVGTRGAGFSNSTISALNDGWYLLSATLSSALGGQTLVGVYCSDADNSFTCVGNGVTAGIYIWGAQLEAGAFATSYIPTVASQVTRAADTASMIGNNFARWFNVNEGTLFGEADGLSTAGTRIFGIGPGPSNLMYLTLTQNAVTASGTSQASFSFTPAANIAYKTAMAYKINDFASSYSGSIATDVSGSVPVGLIAATIGWIESAGSYIGSGHLKRIAYYPRRLANTELQGITS